jgi:hypothetical protein
MQAVYMLLAVVAIGVIVAIAWVFNRAEALDEREDELKEQASALNGKANRLAQEEQNLRGEWAALKNAKEHPGQEVFIASYTVTDSDLLKFSTDRAIVSNAKRWIAGSVARDIVRRIEADESTNSEGRLVLSYRLKITKL